MWKCQECGKKFKKPVQRCSGCRGVDIDLDVPKSTPNSDKGIRQQFLADLEKVYKEDVQ